MNIIGRFSTSEDSQLIDIITLYLTANVNQKLYTAFHFIRTFSEYLVEHFIQTVFASIAYWVGIINFPFTGYDDSRHPPLVHEPHPGLPILAKVKHPRSVFSVQASIKLDTCIVGHCEKKKKDSEQ